MTNPKNTYELPQLPIGVLPYTEEEEKNIKYNGNEDDINLRIAHMLTNAWTTFDSVKNNQRLIKLLQEEEEDKTSDIFFLKAILVQTMDRYGKIFSSSNILENIQYCLKNSKKQQ